MNNVKTLLTATIACLTIASGTRAQEYEWHITYPPPDSGHYAYFFHAADCSGEVCTAVGDKRTPSITTSDRNVLICFRSTDGGETWIEQDAGLPHEKGDNLPQLTQVQQIDSLNAVAIGDGGLIIKTSDGGVSWHQLNIQSTGGIASVHFSDPLTGIVVKGISGSTDPSDTSNILTSHDGGQTWHRAAFCPWNFSSMCHSYGGDNFTAIGYGFGPVYTTHDDWNSVDTSSFIVPWVDSVHVVSLCNFRGADTLVGYGSDWTWGGPNMYITCSTDGGYTWISPSVTDSFISYTGSMSSLDRGIVFYGGSSKQKIAVSRNHGMTWELDGYLFDKSDTIPNSILSVAVTGNNEGVGIFGYLPGTLDPNVLARGVPMSLTVQPNLTTTASIQVNPNPASQAVNIESLEAGKHVDVLDVLGREVLIGRVPASGSLTLDVSSLPAGLYYVSDGSSRAKFVKE